ncbi:MAG: hypothetical protein IKA73_01605 [Alphaproteobacteria bacterium]|nr:hypothetical protein [Alphaproteobacteria bacterium]
MAAKKTKRPVNIGVFHILKSIVDYKMPSVRAAVDAGHRAADEGRLIGEQIDSLERYVVANRYDRNETREAEALISDYRDQLCGIERKIMHGTEMEQHVAAAAQFEKTYKAAVNKHKADSTCSVSPHSLACLQARYDELEAELGRLDDLIFATTINCDPDSRSEDLVQDSLRDLEYYNARYAELVQQQSQIMATIRAHEK